MFSSSSSSTNPSLRVKIPVTGEGKLTINVKSPTSEMYTEIKEADKVEDLEKLIKKAWGDNDNYISLYYKSIKMKSDYLLSYYNLTDGSTVTVSLLAEPPHHHHLRIHHQSKSSCETKKKRPNFNRNQAAARMVKMVVAIFCFIWLRCCLNFALQYFQVIN